MGSAGPRGELGPSGEAGSRGETGTIGEQGRAGERGQRGPDGEGGKLLQTLSNLEQDWARQAGTVDCHAILLLCTHETP